MPDKPKTQRETVDQIWFAIYGTNGNDGIVKRLGRLEKRPWRLWQAAYTFTAALTTLILLILVFLFGTGVL